MLKLSDVKDWKELINQVAMGDCLEGMKLIPDKSIDLILTDPPYGIGADSSMAKDSGSQRGNSAAARSFYETTNWDNNPPSKEIFDEMFRISKNQIIFGGNYFISLGLYNSPCWIVWDKNNGDNGYADCELVWTSFPTAVRKIKYKWQGMLQQDMKHKEIRQHPTQKPTEVMRWILANYSKDTDLICDPFMGSWTTARACKDLGRDFIGFELSEKYCKVGEERLRQQNLF